MKFFAHGAPGSELLGVIDSDRRFDLTPITGSARSLDRAFFEADGPARTRAALDAGALSELASAALDDERYGAPLNPGKILCIGLNYRDHAAETNAEIPAEPILFMKAPDTVVGPTDDVLIPRDSTKTDWEVELGVVIGRTVRYAETPEEGLAAVAGYVLSHDVSEREFQIERGGTWDKGKNCETFNPLGPWVVTADDVADPQDLGLHLSVNGEVKQDGTTADQIFPVGEVVAYLSRFMTLYPGDLINTGTPAGVALGRADTAFLSDGDRVELSIDGLGSQSQTFRQA
jgi:2-keto-4-pentenoate hydratase/2-oxohepta-3-ene-1,7-dioic acid hydratase in catechol pathway